MQTVLAKIVADKAIWVDARKQQQPLASFQNDVQPSSRHFYDALQGTRTAFILECKKASPSGVYKHYASAISVLTDEKYFQGSFDFLPIVSRIAPQPILCKDFIIDPYQIYLARYYQADACLLMLSVLDDEQYRQLSAVAHSLKMGVLTEVSNEEELERAIALGAKVVGINNRDLRDLSIDLNRTRQLAPRLGHGVTVISESGINTYGQVRELSHFANGFLIGSALMSHDDLHAAVRRVLLGENKVCGLTRAQDAKAAYEAGAIYGGLIFVPGVFRHHDIDDVCVKVKNLALTAVQLHGNEDQTYIDTLRAALPEHVQIWKALSVGESLPARSYQHVDKYIFDNGLGGSGQRFDWTLLGGQSLDNVLLAGGLGADNCVEAAKTGCAGLDFNSGVESQPGIKDARLLASVFQTLRAY